MTIRTPIAALIETRMQQLALDRAALGFRLGYRNPAKAAGRVYALCDGHITSTKSRAALHRLPSAIEVPADVVETAVNDTTSLLAELKRQEDEKLRVAREIEDAEWRAAFIPHAIILGDRIIPTSITMCVITGGPERQLKIELDSSKPSDTFVQQALAALPGKLHLGKDGRLTVQFFGYALGFIINYSPDQAVQYDLKGNAVENLNKAFRLGRASFSLKGESRSLTLAAAWNLSKFLQLESVSMGQQKSSKRNDPTRQAPICRTCLAVDGVSNSKVLEKLIGHPMHNNRYPRMVCAACWERGRETAVTCRTFVPPC